MNDVDLLSHALRELSVSDREIVLAFDDAVVAATYLASRGVAIPSWEGWLLRSDGTHTHSKTQGTVWLARQTAEPWDGYVNRCLTFTLETMRAGNALFRTSDEACDGRLYFCFSILQPDSE